MRDYLMASGMENEQVDGALENLYSNLDHNKDGVITQNEFPIPQEAATHDEL